MSRPAHFVTSSDKSPLVELLTWTFLSIAGLAALARLLTKILMVGRLAWDDYLAILATLATVGQSVAVIVQCANGLGRPIEGLDAGHVSAVLKSEYAGNILLIMGFLFAKLSILRTMAGLTQHDRKRLLFSIEICTILWAFSAVVTALFQCQLPMPWDHIGHSCIDRTAFWTYFSVTNVILDLAIVATTIETVRRVRMPWSKKAVVISVFGSRILLVPAIALQICYSNKAIKSQDPTFDMWRSTVAIQLAQCLSITTLCIPFLKPFFDSLELDLFRIDDSAGQMKMDVRSSSSRLPAGTRSGGQGGTLEAPKASITAPERCENAPSLDEVQSYTSHSMLIKQTKTWEISVEGG
ncbi:hypothetical protein PT974_01332 [Cladobotryum mycophilum]|uniref:Rhodopsin domain-containing protein n=1 Tax=Cladobotryum mycophilum TaxID=491253 RepID=A0ABR0T3B7_9HYPO